MIRKEGLTENEVILLDIVKRILLGKEKFSNLENAFNSILELDNINKSKVNILKRIVLCYRGILGNKGNLDMFSNIRQAIITFNVTIHISEHIYKIFKSIDYNTGLMVLEDSEGRYFDSEKQNINYLDNNILNNIDIYSQNTFDKENNVTGDYKLKEVTKFENYRSNCQKLIVRAMESQLDGSTILATMPTGGGKSLPTQIISYFEKNGTTVVVVPTVALVIDQENSSRKLLKNKKVYGYHSGLEVEEKQEIFEDLENGKVSILYTSPEAIINGRFYTELLKLAEIGIFNRLVIDEAHLVVDWGDFFRTEFQFLSVFRKEILKRCGNLLKTVLLSATITPKTEEVLKNIYSEGDNFIQIRGDSLREEIDFYKVICSSDRERQERVQKIIPLIPKPFIIYVPTIERANEYYNICEDLKLNRIEKFTSNTDAKDRKRILNSWDNDRTDIIIATSAFGMGVDKKEVRAVIHTFSPENIDRLYQEVGRGGRDGYRSLSILFYSKKVDEGTVRYFTQNKVLRIDSLIARWKSIKQECEERLSGDEYIIKVSSVHDKLLGNIYTGKLNEAWNEYVILFMYRKKIIDITDILYDKLSGKRLLKIRILRVDIAEDYDMLKAYLTPIRDIERMTVANEISNIKNIVANNDICWGTHFSRVYENTDAKCIGCPTCRQTSREYLNDEDYFEITEGAKFLNKSFMIGKESREDFYVTENLEADNIKVLGLIDKLDIDCVIVENNDLIKYLKNNFNKAHIYTYSEALDSSNSYIRGNILIVAQEGRLLDKVYIKYAKFKGSKVGNFVVLGNKDIKINSLKRKLTELIEGRILKI